MTTHGHAHHGHAPHHHHHAHATQRRLLLALVVHLLYIAVEIAGALRSGALSLWADAGHMVSDSASLGLALFATWFASRPASSRHTFGFYRAEILAALANSTALLLIAVFIIREAVQRLAGVDAHDHGHVHGGILTLVATGGLIANLVTLKILHGGSGENLNVRAAWLHVLVDTVGSVQAIATGLLIMFFDWDWADPVASILISVLIVYSAWSLMKEALAVLMESAPAHVDVDHVRDRLMQVPGVTAVHSLHVWSITTGMAAMSAHVCAERPAREVILELRRDLKARYGITQSTLEFDPGDADLV
jgi:cobalt-zinc-cadmium efflux system protein